MLFILALFLPLLELMGVHLGVEVGLWLPAILVLPSTKLLLVSLKYVIDSPVILSFLCPPPIPFYTLNSHPLLSCYTRCNWASSPRLFPVSASRRLVSRMLSDTSSLANALMGLMLSRWVSFSQVMSQLKRYVSIIRNLSTNIQRIHPRLLSIRTFLFPFIIFLRFYIT